MAVIVIASDLKDEYVTSGLPKLLSAAGHTSEVVHPLEQMVSVVRTTCIACGGIDLGVLVHSTATSSGRDSPYRVASLVRNLPDTFAFRNAVKGKSFPLLVIGKDLTSALSGSAHDDLRKLSWVSTYSIEPAAETLAAAINGIIFKWRTDLLHELDCVGYAIIIDANGNLSVNPTFKKSELEGEILAASTSLSQLRESGYLIVSSDLCRAARTYQELAYLVENFRPIAQKKKTKPEEVFQGFFKKHPQLLFQESFAKLWPKPRLPLPEDLSKWLEPDFVVKPAVSPQIGSNWKVLDVKLPDVKHVKGSKFHPTFSAKLNAAIQQVANYRHYFGRVDAAPHMLSQFGFQPRNPQLAVLIGRELTPESAKILDEVFVTSQKLDVSIITYDEVLGQQSQRIANDLAWLKNIT